MQTKDKTSYTPGPWDMIVSRSLIHIETANTGDGSPCGVHVCSVPKSAEANARLIAAAPDLLEALATLVAWLDDSGLSSTKPGGVGVFAYDGTEYSVVTEARAALDKVVQS